MKAFVSCSNHPDDYQLINCFKTLFYNLGFSSVTVGQEIKVPDHLVVETIRREIENSTCLILIGTPRYETCNFKLKMAEALHEEFFMAYVSEKPILAFIEQGLDLKGLLPYINSDKVTWVNFDKYHLNFNDALTVEEINSYLYELKDKVKYLKDQEITKKVGKVILFLGALGLTGLFCYKLGKSGSNTL